MENSQNLKSWLKDYNLNHPMVIAGPCSAETEAQMLDAAFQLKDSKTSIFRAGIWKPRTRPGNFEGVGAIGLKWLQTVKQETGLQTATEVANANHVELALEHDVDVLWIGARTTVNPFMVQELANALAGVDKPVLVKNPVNPDLALWLGAVERLYKSNIRKLGVIHRGFSSYEKSKYRNKPEWQIPIELQNQFPDLPLFVDPSHIGGRRDLILELCQKALDLNYNGMMIETHPTPEKAWSDAEQQVTPDRLKEILKSLVVRDPQIEGVKYINELEKLRTKIDSFDDTLLRVLGERMTIVEDIGRLKKSQNVAVLQNARWHEILKKMVDMGEKENLSAEFVTKIFQAIHQESINHQEQIMNQK
ncbi:MAG: bifunctional 3-deoxy-7-phosphoheptulonate synthase/chorismate mutase type II [Bacteroidetes bacterium]|jgi:chorismate mutase|nr:bifunctional 3-deoxy-7-phosphoheptulonate synthase/chorismate mutase type II [Bacteroidota bacterium]MDA0879949.1 bifunctional 3-deoxy-7-phosphoheptulonate synthase/chorismate mutase type II [Bacteroidota bacterium]MDA1115294.1 bifunctional 3-deoxy-7-phosphoheptulonate synthase/chorismate mutase type II [Bacteroidota bacterium]